MTPMEEAELLVLMRELRDLLRAQEGYLRRIADAPLFDRTGINDIHNHISPDPAEFSGLSPRSHRDDLKLALLRLQELDERLQPRPHLVEERGILDAASNTDLMVVTRALVLLAAALQQSDKT